MKVKLSSIALFFLYFYLVTETFGGLLLYVLSLVGLESLFYIRDLSFIVIIFLYLIVVATKLKIRKGDLILFFIFIIQFLWGLINLPNIYLVLFGVKLFLPLFAGYFIYYFYEQDEIKISKTFIYSLWIVSVGGVLMNYFIYFPWEGHTVNIGNIDIETSRSWNAYGTEFRRLVGFTRGASAVAINIAVFSLFSILKYKSNYRNFLIIIITVIVLLLTTMKGVFLAYFATICCILLYERFRNIIHYVPLASFIISAIVVLFSNILLYIFLTQNQLIFIAIYSFLDRMYRVWPEGVSLIMENGNAIFGRGIGGIGVSQIYFESHNYNPADNLFLHIWGNFGMIGVAALLYVLYFLGRVKIQLKEIVFVYIVLLFTINGITSAVTSNAIYNLFFGVSIGFIISKINEKGISNNNNQK